MQRSSNSSLEATSPMDLRCHTEPSHTCKQHGTSGKQPGGMGRQGGGREGGEGGGLLGYLVMRFNLAETAWLLAHQGREKGQLGGQEVERECTALVSPEPVYETAHCNSDRRIPVRLKQQKCLLVNALDGVLVRCCVHKGMRKMQF